MSKVEDEKSEQKRKKEQQHPIDECGLLEAAKYAKWDAFNSCLSLAASSSLLSAKDINELPPGRNYGVIHQIAYNGYRPALEKLLALYPKEINLKILTKDGKTALDIAEEQRKKKGVAVPKSLKEFIEYITDRIRTQTHHELCNMARDNEWGKLLPSLKEIEDPSELEIFLNTIPKGRKWGIIHQICFWGKIHVLEEVLDHFPDLDLELSTNEKKSSSRKLPIQIASDEDHATFAATLDRKIEEKKKSGASSIVTKRPATEESSLESNKKAKMIEERPILYMKDPVSAAELSKKAGGWILGDEWENMAESSIMHQSLNDAPEVARDVALKMDEKLDGATLPAGESDETGRIVVIKTIDGTTTGSLPTKEDCLKALGLKREIGGNMLINECTISHQNWSTKKGFCYDDDEDEDEDDEDDEDRTKILATTALMAFLTDHFKMNFSDEICTAPVLYGGRASDGNIVAVLSCRVWT